MVPVVWARVKTKVDIIGEFSREIFAFQFEEGTITRISGSSHDSFPLFVLWDNGKSCYCSARELLVRK
jgi:hypothetical protein